jgi:protease-4
LTTFGAELQLVSCPMRFLALILWDVWLVAVWPLRLVLRMAFGHPPPPIVELRVRGAWRYREGGARSLRWRSRDRAPSLQGLRALFERVAREPRSLGVALRLEGPTGSAAQWAELASAISWLQGKGKHVAIFAEALDGTTYAAVCGAHFIAMPPSGALELVGLFTELTSAGPALAKLGVRPVFVRRESYKTAPEIFTEAEPSAIQRAQTQSLLDRLFERLIADLGRRSLSSEAARKVVDAGPYTGRTALAAGLIDEVLFHDQLRARLQERWGGRVPVKVAEGDLPGASRLRSAGRIPPLGLRSPRRAPAVGVVMLEGLIRSGRSGALPLAGRLCGSESAAEVLGQARRSRQVRSVVVAIESRGGSALASEIIWREIRRTADAKPTLIYVDRVAASGGYLAACGAERILSAPLALVGSIGVFAGRFDVKEVLDRLGIRREPLQRGARAGLVGKSGPLDAEERMALEAMVEESYQAFISLVAQARHKSLEETLGLAQGKVYTGEQALPLGLIDRVCGFEEAVAEAAAQGGVAGEPPAVRIFGSPLTRGLLARVWAAGGALAGLSP